MPPVLPPSGDGTDNAHWGVSSALKAALTTLEAAIARARSAGCGDDAISNASELLASRSTEKRLRGMLVVFKVRVVQGMKTDAVHGPLCVKCGAC